MASGADTQTHTYTHTYIRTEVILRNQARAWFNKDCGLFAIAMFTSTAFGNDPSKQNFCQDLMRAHLVDV